jgi:hypothetical protein
LTRVKPGRGRKAQIAPEKLAQIIEPGRAGAMTHDYKRNGTTTLFAALSMLDGSVIGQCLPRHRHQEFLKFLRTLGCEFPPRA